MATSSAKPNAAAQGAVSQAGKLLYFSALIGLWTFGLYIVLRAGGATFRNFRQWQGLLGNEPIASLQGWIANIGIGAHFMMGFILVTAWPILFSATIRRKQPAVHRWTGRIYVTAGGLAGVGGLSYILTHGAMDRYQNIAFGTWGLCMAGAALMTYLNARARRIAVHREWAIRLFALVLGSWLFDLEYRTWGLLTGGMGIGEDSRGWFDYLADYLFFVPNLLVAEYYIRRKRINSDRRVQRAILATLVLAVALLCYAFWATSISPEGKFGKHLASLFVATP